MRVPIRFVFAVITVLAACEHSAPFRPGAYGPAGPLFPGPIARLTFNPGQDLTPAWLSDGSGIVYTGERGDRADRDRCLAFLPASGGAISRYACRTSVSDDSINVFDEAASSEGRVAYIRSSTWRGVPRLGPDAQQLVVAPDAAPNDVQVVQVVPLTTPWGRTYDAVSYIGWLGPSRLVMIGDNVRYPRPCSSCAADTVRTGIEIVTLDFSGATQLSLVPGTSGATSVSPGAFGDTIYFTLAGDSRIHRYALSSGQEDFPHDFGSGRAVRDVRVANGVLVAVVDGHMDDGGDLHVVTLASGADSLIGVPPSLGGPLWFQRPSLSPDGRRIVVQGRGLVITPIFDPGTGDVIGFDTTGAPGRDIWLVERP